MKTIVAVYSKNIDEIKKELLVIKDKNISIIEIRADYLEDTSTSYVKEVVSYLRENTEYELMLTLRSKREGGKFSGLDYADKILMYLSLDIDYIDIQMNELSDQTLSELIEFKNSTDIKVVFSVHDMTRPMTKGIFRHYFMKAKDFGADIVKIVDMPSNIKEVVSKLELSGKYDKWDKPELISISMGDLGKISRYQTNIYKPKYTFINANENIEIGQIKLREMDVYLHKTTNINFYTTLNTIVGKLYIYSDLKGLNQITFDLPRKIDGIVDIKYADAILRETVNQLEEYFTKERKEFEIKLSFKSSEFYYKMYDQLKSVEYGETITYNELAKLAGCDNSSRACGNAMANNQIPIVIACHRVIRSNGEIGEYIGGSHRKKILLDLEGEQ